MREPDGHPAVVGPIIAGRRHNRADRGHAPLGPYVAIGLLLFAVLAFFVAALLSFFPELIGLGATSGFALAAYGWGFLFPGLHPFCLLSR